MMQFGSDASPPNRKRAIMVYASFTVGAPAFVTTETAELMAVTMTGDWLAPGWTGRLKRG